MKKFIFAAVAVLAMSMFASCNGSSNAAATDSDSIEVVTDSLAVDSIAVDSIAVDSAAFACDSTCTCVE